MYGTSLLSSLFPSPVGDRNSGIPLYIQLMTFEYDKIQKSIQISAGVARNIEALLDRMEKYGQESHLTKMRRKTIKFLPV